MTIHQTVTTIVWKWSFAQFNIVHLWQHHSTMTEKRFVNVLSTAVFPNAKPD